MAHDPTPTEAPARSDALNQPARGSTPPDPGGITYGVLYDVSKALEGRGYGPFDGPQLVELAQHLQHFLYGGVDRCYGRSAATGRPTVHPWVEDKTTGVEQHRSEVDRKRTALRQSRAKLDTAMARHDQRRGIER